MELYQKAALLSLFTSDDLIPAAFSQVGLLLNNVTYLAHIPVYVCSALHAVSKYLRQQDADTMHKELEEPGGLQGPSVSFCPRGPKRSIAVYNRTS